MGLSREDAPIKARETRDRGELCVNELEIRSEGQGRVPSHREKKNTPKPTVVLTATKVKIASIFWKEKRYIYIFE